MDMERRRAEAADIKRRPRLVENDEVPQHFHKQSELADQMSQGLLSTQESDKIMFGDSKRKRKEVRSFIRLLLQQSLFLFAFWRNLDNWRVGLEVCLY